MNDDNVTLKKSIYLAHAHVFVCVHVCVCVEIRRLETTKPNFASIFTFKLMLCYVLQ